MKDSYFLLVLLGVGALLFFMAKKTSATVQNAPRVYGFPKQITPENSYENEEVREIEYNGDGLPIRITIHRSARAA